MPPTLHKTQCLSIIGKRGTGKTSLARKLIAEHKGIIFINDFIGEYDGQPFRTRQEITELKQGGMWCYRSPANDAHEFCEIVWQAGKSGLHVLAVFDEIDVYGKNDNSIAWVYRYGRHRNITCIAVSRRFYDLPVIVRSLTHEWLLFNITDERDIKYLSGYLSESAARQVSTLPDFQYIKIAR